MKKTAAMTIMFLMSGAGGLMASDLENYADAAKYINKLMDVKEQSNGMVQPTSPNVFVNFDFCLTLEDKGKVGEFFRIDINHEIFDKEKKSAYSSQSNVGWSVVFPDKSNELQGEILSGLLSLPIQFRLIKDSSNCPELTKDTGGEFVAQVHIHSAYPAFQIVGQYKVENDVNYFFRGVVSEEILKCIFQLSKSMKNSGRNETKAVEFPFI